MLFVSASPTGLAVASVEDETRALRQELARGAARARLTLHPLPAAQPLDLLRALRTLRPAIVQFSGHAHLEGLMLQGHDGAPRPVSGDAVAMALTATGSPTRLVILNACDTEAHAAAVRPHVDCVIAVRGAISSAAALALSVGLHGALITGASVAAAFAQGRAAIALEAPQELARPVLLTRDGVDPDTIVLVGR